MLASSITFCGRKKGHTTALASNTVPTTMHHDELHCNDSLTALPHGTLLLNCFVTELQVLIYLARSYPAMGVRKCP
jgi:hypothetical protein